VPVSKIPDWGGGFDLSPDGQSVAFVGLMKPAPEYLLKLNVISLGSGQIVQSFDNAITAGFNHVRFTRDGKAILFVKHSSDGDSLWLQPLDRSPEKLLTTLKGDVVWDMRYSPDGKKLVVIRAHTDSDVVLLQSQ
jgi:Tol biopolymer transport system component